METQAVVGNHYQPTNESLSRRLWCVFELAAFLHSRQGKAVNLEVCPVLVGCTLLAGHLGLSLLHLIFVCIPGQLDWFPYGLLLIAVLAFPSLTIGAHTVIQHYQSIDRIHQQVHNFTVDQTECGCCAMGHVNKRTGEPMACDREIIYRCINAWFGSLRQFEDHVRGEVREVMIHQLTFQTFTYWRMVQLASPVIFINLDVLASRARREGGSPVVPALALVRDWLVVLPTGLLLACQTAYKLRRYGATQLKRLLLSLLVVLVGVALYTAAALTAHACHHLLEDEVLAGVVVLAVLSPPALLMWWQMPRGESRLADSGHSADCRSQKEPPQCS